MLRKLGLGLALVATAVLAVAPATAAQDKVTGEFDLTFNGCWDGPTEAIPDWIGTVDLDGNAYDMVFFNVGSGWPPGHAPAEPLSAFNEIWAVYEGLDVTFSEDCAMETYDGELVLWGHDTGTGDMEAGTYEMSGTVIEGFGDYADLAGSTVAMQGTFGENADGVLEAPGVLEIG